MARVITDGMIYRQELCMLAKSVPLFKWKIGEPSPSVMVVALLESGRVVCGKLDRGVLRAFSQTDYGRIASYVEETVVLECLSLALDERPL